MKGGQPSATPFNHLEGIFRGGLVDQQAMRIGRIVLTPVVHRTITQLYDLGASANSASFELNAMYRLLNTAPKNTLLAIELILLCCSEILTLALLCSQPQSIVPSSCNCSHPCARGLFKVLFFALVVASSVSRFLHFRPSFSDRAWLIHPCAPVPVPGIILEHCMSISPRL
jgi:hypothetical protein